MNLTGNTILITGGASGIGLELAKELVQRKNTVIITGRRKDKLEQAKRSVPQLNIIQSDVGRVQDIEALHAKVMQEFPALNVLINNAGVMRQLNLHLEDETLEQVTSEIDINFKGPVQMVRKFLLHLKKAPSAAIVNVTSGLAFVPLPTSPVYCATKAALHSYTLSLRVQLKGTKVKVFEIAPPATQTDLLSGSSHPDDLKGVPVMPVAEMVRVSLKGLEEDKLEIRPGQSNQLKFMSRLAPEFILGQLSKPVDRMLKSSV